MSLNARRGVRGGCSAGQPSGSRAMGRNPPRSPKSVATSLSLNAPTQQDAKPNAVAANSA